MGICAWEPSKTVKNIFSFAIVLLFCVACILLALFDHNIDEIETKQIFDDGNMLNREACPLPTVTLFNEPLKRLWKLVEQDNCSTHYLVSRLTDDERLLIYEDVGKGCCVRDIERPYLMPGDKYNLGKDCIPVENGTDVSQKQLFLVECTRKDNSGIIYNFHATSFQNSTVPPKQSYWDSKFKKTEKRPISVMLIILDSVSRHDAFRSLPETMYYLLQDHGFVDFRGQHILGEPAFPNILPLLLGTAAEDFWGKQKTEWKSPWDPYPFIWSNFSKLNYITLFAEDDVGVFNYNGQQGFSQQPTDYYLRPLFESHREGVFSSMSHSKEYCFGIESATEFSLNYQKKILLKYQDYPQFSLNRISWPQKENLESLTQLDKITFKFFQTVLGSRAVYENTVIVFMSDHGSTYHPYSSTFEGLLERRLPLLLFHLPKNLALKNPDYQKNLKLNSGMLTSHFDTFETLSHLVRLATETVNGKNVANKSIPTPKPNHENESNEKDIKSIQEFKKSLLDEIEPSRTCKDAHIPPTICSCNLPSPPITTNFNALHQIMPDIVKLPPFDKNELPFPNEEKKR